MSDSWSWACVIASNGDNLGNAIVKVVPNLSTCPESNKSGQVDRSILPLNIKSCQDLDICPSEEFDERAAIMEYDAGLSRHEAELAAMKDIKQ